MGPDGLLEGVWWGFGMRDGYGIAVTVTYYADSMEESWMIADGD